jgi:hypothetical protein
MKPSAMFLQLTVVLVLSNAITATGADDPTDDKLKIQRGMDGGVLRLAAPGVAVNTLVISNDIRAEGVGYLRGGSPIGRKPTSTELRSGSKAQRLVRLQQHYPSIITLTKSVVISGNLDLRDVLIASTDGATLTATGEVRLSNVALHNVQLQANGRGFVEAHRLISTDSPGTGLYATRGGTISAPKGVIVKPASRGGMAQYGGVIDLAGGEVYDCGSQGLFIHFGGTIVFTGGIVEGSASHGVLINYGGAIDISGGSARNNAGSGIVSESNGAIYAQNAAVTGNADVGISTSYGGFVNAQGATIRGNRSFAAYANGGGYIDLKAALVDATNNATRTEGQIVRAIGNGFIYAEEPGVGAGKESLPRNSYYPGYNTVGGAAAYVGTFTGRASTR